MRSVLSGKVASLSRPNVLFWGNSVFFRFSPIPLPGPCSPHHRTPLFTQQSHLSTRNVTAGKIGAKTSHLLLCDVNFYLLIFDHREMFCLWLCNFCLQYSKCQVFFPLSKHSSFPNKVQHMHAAWHQALQGLLTSLSDKTHGPSKA
jgi:hypothetical protein